MDCSASIEKGSFCGPGPSFIDFIHVPREAEGGVAYTGMAETLQALFLFLPPSLVTLTPHFSSLLAETVIRPSLALILGFSALQDFLLDSFVFSSRPHTL